MTEPKTFDRLFNTWEKRTSEYFEKLLSNPAVLNLTGGALNTSFKNKIYVDKALLAFWKNLLLPNKRDQERTLHLLNELHSRIHDLEEKLESLQPGSTRIGTATAKPVARPSARTTTRKGGTETDHVAAGESEDSTND